MSERLEIHVDDLKKMLAMTLEKEVLDRSVPASGPKSEWGSGCVASMRTVSTGVSLTRGIQENVLVRSSISRLPTIANSYLKEEDNPRRREEQSSMQRTQPIARICGGKVKE